MLQKCNTPFLPSYISGNLLVLLVVVDQHQPWPSVSDQSALNRMEAQPVLLSIVELDNLGIGHGWHFQRD